MHRKIRRTSVVTGLAAAVAAVVAGVPFGTGVAHAASIYPSSAPIVGVSATPDGKGYWEVAADGGIFAYGDAKFYGSMGGQHLNAPVVGIARTPDGGGYWLAGADGGIFAYGDAKFYGSMADQTLNDPVTGIAAAPAGGYWLTAADGGVFAFGNARFYGSMASTHLAASVDAIAAVPNGSGYWLAGVDGGIFAFGGAAYDGRASYTPPRPAPSTTGQKAANLAAGWLGYNWRGVNGNDWDAAGAPEYWCSDFATYVWEQAGINVPITPGVLSFIRWAQNNGHFTSNLADVHVGDVIFYNNGGTKQHVGVIIQVNADGTVETADGDWGGSTGNVTETYFAEHSSVALNSVNPKTGRGAAGTIVGIGLIG